MNISRAWALTQIVVRAHVLNWLWRPRAVRSAVRCDVFSNIAVRYFKRYLPAAAAVKEVSGLKTLCVSSQTGAGVVELDEEINRRLAER